MYVMYVMYVSQGKVLGSEQARSMAESITVRMDGSSALNAIRLYKQIY